MSIEWREARNAEVQWWPVDSEDVDGHGNRATVGDGALVIGNGVAIEGTRAELRAFLARVSAVLDAVDAEHVCGHCGWHASRCAALPARSACCVRCDHASVAPAAMPQVAELEECTCDRLEDGPCRVHDCRCERDPDNPCPAHD